MEVRVRYAIDSRMVTVAPSELEPTGGAKTGISELEITEEASSSNTRTANRKKHKVFFNTVLHRKSLRFFETLCMNFAQSVREAVLQEKEARVVALAAKSQKKKSRKPSARTRSRMLFLLRTLGSATSGG